MRTATLTLLVAICTLSAATYKKVPTEEKAKGKDLTFLVTFDNYNTHADFAAAERFSNTMKDVNLMLRGTVGFDQQQGYTPQSPENLTYPAIGNAKWQEGTMIFWIQGGDYAPGKSGRGSTSYAQIRIRNEEHYIDYRVYEFAGVAYFDAYATEKLSTSTVGRAVKSLKGIEQGEWFQVAVTWDTALTIYINGRFGMRKELPAIVLQNRIIDDPLPSSYIGVRNRFHVNNYTTRIDDFAIYSRALTETEIANQYNKLLLDGERREVQEYGVKLHGVDRGNGKDCDILEAAFDFSPLSEKRMQQYQEGKLSIDYVLWKSGNRICTGNWVFKAGETLKYLPNIKQAGTYKLETILDEAKVNAEIERPDLSFIGNDIALEENVQAPWSFTWTGQDILLGNRTYKMGKRPLPEQILIDNKPLFRCPPRLLCNGKPITAWHCENTCATAASVTFEGTAPIADGGKIRFSSIVEFDGFIDFKYWVLDKPQLTSMEFDWQLESDFCKFVMTPEVWEGTSRQYASPYYTPENRKAARELWLTSEKGGFCYANEHDANWIYDAGTPLYFANQDTGECRVTMISTSVPRTIPHDAKYHAFFIATPTRPLPDPIRAYRHCDSIGSHNLLDANSMARYGVLTGVSTFEPHPTQFEKFFQTRKSWGIYGLAGAMTTASPVANYFRKYWDVPGASNFLFQYTRFSPDGKTSRQETHEFVLGCSTVLNDLYQWNIRKLCNFPANEGVKALFFDCSSCGYCTSPLHGCAFIDDLGRNIRGTLAIRRLRDLFKRTSRQLHAHQKELWIHAQRDFFPMVHGFADAWFPGEQFEGSLAHNINYYTDELPEILFRSELNSQVLGVRVILWSVVTSLQRSKLPPEQLHAATEAMCSILLLYDIEPSAVFTRREILAKVWDIMEKYNITGNATTFHQFDQQTELVASVPEMRISWWESPDGRRLAVASNTSPQAVTADIDVSRLASGKTILHDEYTGAELPVSNGKIKLTLQPRTFSLIGF